MNDAFVSMTAIILAICAFALVFYCVAQISWYYMETYRNFSIQEQKDWCARYVRPILLLL